MHNSPFLHVSSVFLVAFCSVFLLTHAMLRLSYFSRVMDCPNERSLHTKPTPRMGGIAIVLGVLSGWFFGEVQHGPLWAGVGALALLSFADDLKGLGIVFRLSTHAAAATSFVMWLPVQWNYLGVGLAVVAMVWMINLYNFMDGSDGLAGGMAAFGFGTYAIAAWMHGDHALVVLAIAVTAASLAFLWFNFHPARIFMGDVGSIPLGFLAGALGLLGWQREAWPLWFPVLVFSPFVVDATATLAKRILKSEKFWLAHRSHYYQRLVLMGWGHRRTAISEYVLMLLAALTGLWLLQGPAVMQWPVLCLWLAIYLGLMLKIDKMWAKAAHEMASACP